jgi:hypothetical protein
MDSGKKIENLKAEVKRLQNHKRLEYHGDGIKITAAFVNGKIELAFREQNGNFGMQTIEPREEVSGFKEFELLVIFSRFVERYIKAHAFGYDNATRPAWPLSETELVQMEHDTGLSIKRDL